jgi:hypothetical protein
LSSVSGTASIRAGRDAIAQAGQVESWYAVPFLAMLAGWKVRQNATDAERAANPDLGKTGIVQQLFLLAGSAGFVAGMIFGGIYLAAGALAWAVVSWPGRSG